MTVGDHPITAVYDGDANYFGSASDAVTEKVNRVSTSTSLAISATTPLAGADTMDLTATVSANAFAILTGSVDFFDTSTGQDLGSVDVVNGVATLLAAGPFTAGTHVVSAIYSDTTTLQSSSGTASLTALAPASLSGLVFEDFNHDGRWISEKWELGAWRSLSPGLTTWATASVYPSKRTVPAPTPSRASDQAATPSRRPLSRRATRQGLDSIGTAGGSLAGTDQFLVSLAAGAAGLNYNYGEQPTGTGSIQPGQTAGIGFWNNKNGQGAHQGLEWRHWHPACRLARGHVPAHVRHRCR